MQLKKGVIWWDQAKVIVWPFQHLEWIFTYNISTSSFAKGKEVKDQ